MSQSFDGGPGAGMIAAARGADVKLMGCEWPGVPYAVFVGRDIASPQDLKDKIIAISSPGANPDVVARAALAHFNVPIADVRFANLGSDLDRFKAVVAGVAQATVVSNEYTPPLAEAQGIKLLVRAGRCHPRFHACLHHSLHRQGARRARRRCGAFSRRRDVGAHLRARPSRGRPWR